MYPKKWLIAALLGGLGLIIVAIIGLSMSFGPPKQEWLFGLSFVLFIGGLLVFLKSLAYLIAQWWITKKEEK